MSARTGLPLEELTASLPRYVERSGEIRRVYIAGPMSGIDDFNYPAFHVAAKAWRDLGYEVVNPAENFQGDQTLPYWVYLKAAIGQVLDCDAVVVLDDWQQSNGARVEVQVADTIGLPVFLASAPGALIPAETKIAPAGEPTVQGCPEMPGLKSRAVFDFAGEVDGGGYKGSMDDPGKLPMWLVPKALLDAAARALQHGAAKYAPNNWRRGMKWSETYSALLRHLTAWNDGEDADPDSGLHHFDHAAACLAFLCEYVAHPELYGSLDDRFKRPGKEARDE